MADEIDGNGHNVMVSNRKEEGLGVHSNVYYKFAITSPDQDIPGTVVGVYLTPLTKSV